MEKTEISEKEQLANTRVEKSTKRIAQAINLLAVSKDELQWACESMNWDTMITFDIEEAMAKLGSCLAGLVTWNDDEKEEELV